MPEQRQPSSAGILGDSWGGWVVVLLAGCVLLYPPVLTLVDGQRQVITDSGRVVVQTGGAAGTLMAAAMLLAALACSAAAFTATDLPRARLGSAVTFPLVLLLGWALLVTWLRGDGALPTFNAACTVVLALAVVVSAPTVTTVARLSTLRDLLVLGSLAYNASGAPGAEGVCRDDKCGVFGSLWYGLFGNENAAGASIALLLPTLVVARRRRYWFSLLIAGIFLAATGSRTALLAGALCVVFMETVRRRTTAAPLLLFRAAPLAALALSLAVFLGSSGRELTGRGGIYAEIRQHLSNPTALLVGAGPDAISNLLDGWVSSAHGEAPNALAMLGLPGFLLLVLALVQLPFVSRWTWQRQVATAVLITAAARFPTEAGLTLTLRTPEVLMMVLAIGLFAAPADGDVFRAARGRHHRHFRRAQQGRDRPVAARR